MSCDGSCKRTVYNAWLAMEQTTWCPEHTPPEPELPPCHVCGEEGVRRSNRCAEWVCPACFRDEEREDVWDRMWDRGNQWQENLGMEVGY